MPAGLTRGLIGARIHPGDPGIAEMDPHEHALRVDHAAFSEAGARLVLPALVTLGVPRIRAGFALMAPRGALPAGTFSGIAAGMHEVALGLGIHVLRPAAGRLEAIYVDRFASPGRVVVGAGVTLAAAGALGALALECGELELASVLAGAPRFARDDAVLGIRLTGSPAPYVSGQDVAFEIARRLAPGGAGGRLVEFTGDGVASLSMSDRMVLAGGSGEWGAAAALFPADEVAREWLTVHGRASEWRKSEATDEGGDEWIDLDLGVIEPQVAELGRPSAARPLPGAGGAEVARVAIGPAATAADLARFAGWLKGRDLPNGVRITLTPGSRERLESADHAGAIAELVAQGVSIEAGGDVRPGSGARENGVSLCFGALPSDFGAPRSRWWTAGLEACAAAALSGRLVDPRRVVLAADGRAEPPAVGGDDAWTLKPRLDAEASRTPAWVGLPAVPLGEPLAGPVRGRVLLRCGDGVTTEQVLPWGARIAPLAGDIGALRMHAFATLDPEFAERAVACGGGLVLAGDSLGHGEPREQAALVLASLGVRAVIARSWAPAFHRRLRDAGVLPLTFGRSVDLDAFAAGEEIELPTLPHGLEPGRPVVVRNLTRGTQLDVRHDLDARAVAIARGGGLLRYGSAFRERER